MENPTMTTIQLDATVLDANGHPMTAWGEPITFDGDAATVAYAANHVAQAATALANTVGGGQLAFKLLTDLADSLRAVSEQVA